MNSKITFNELAELLAEATNTPKRVSDLYLKELFATIAQALVDGDSVTINGLGEFSLNYVAPRKSMDVNTGQEIEISGHNRVIFTPDKALANDINAPFAEFETIELSDDFTQEKLDAIDAETPEQIAPAATIAATDSSDDTTSDATDDSEPESTEEIPVEIPAKTTEEITEKVPEKTAITPPPFILPMPPVMTPEPAAEVPVPEPEPAEEPAEEPQPEILEATEALSTEEPQNKETQVTENKAEEPTQPAEEPKAAEPQEEPAAEPQKPRKTTGVCLVKPLPSEQQYQDDDNDTDDDDDDYEEESWLSRNSLFVGMVLGFIAAIAIGVIVFAAFRPQVATFLGFQAPETAVTTADSIATDNVAVQPDTAKAVAAAAAAKKPVEKYDTVRSTLSKIARKHYDKSEFWVYIYLENKDKIHDPNNVAPGTVVKIPEASKYGIDANSPESLAKARQEAAKALAK